MFAWLRRLRMPRNVLTGLNGGAKGSIEIAYRNEGGPRFSLLLHTAANSTALSELYRQMSDLGLPTLTVTIRPRPSRGKSFTTGHRDVDFVSGQTITHITTSGTFHPQMMQLSDQGYLVLKNASLKVECLYYGKARTNYVYVKGLMITPDCSVIIY